MNNPLTNKLIEELQQAVNTIAKEDYDGAIQKLNGIIQAGEIVSQSLVQRGRCHWEMKRWDKALPDFELAVKMETDNPDIQWTCSLMHLQLGQFPEGWANIDARWRSSRFDSARLKTKTPLWRPGHGREVLVWSEQGVGDQILYCSMLGTMRKEVDDMLVMVDARLIPLLERGYPDIKFCPQNVRVKGIDSNIPMGSIGRNYVSELDEIPRVRETRYLRADSARVEALKAKLGIKREEFVIGLSWSSAAPAIGDHKSVQLKELEGLFDIPNVRVINMQYSNSFKQIYDFEARTGYRIESVPCIDNRDDLDGLAALMMVCDCVVSVSNATAHLAGALGVKTFMLDGNKLWFWNNRYPDGRSLWYPSVKTYQRDHVHAPWTPQAKELVNDVKAFYGKLERGGLFIERQEAKPEDQGDKPRFVFFHVGDDVIVPQKMVNSIREHMPDAYIVMCTDRDTPQIKGVDEMLIGNYPRDRLMEARLSAFADANLQKPAMYIDTDMIFQAPVNPTELLGDKDVMVCRRSFHRDSLFNVHMTGFDMSEYEGDTMDQVYPYLACATITRDYKSWMGMHSLLTGIIPDKYKVWYGDQEALKIMAQGMDRNKVGYLNEWEYACLPEFEDEIIRVGLMPKIIHYKGDRKNKL